MTRLVAVAAVLIALVPALAAAQSLSDGAVTLHVKDGRPIVDGVFVNGHGPYRFLLDTGATLNQIDPRLASTIGLTATFQTSLTSSSGVVAIGGVKDADVRLASATAGAQVFLLGGMDAIHHFSSDIQGVLGQVFLTRFDYLLDMRAGRIVFGADGCDANGTKLTFHLVHGRPVVPTSLGSLVLDSGAQLLVRYRVAPDNAGREMLTTAGRATVGAVASTLVVGGRQFWRGDAMALAKSDEVDSDGLLPAGVFHAIYVCNSEQYVVLN
jgi:hypothetical protein